MISNSGTTGDGWQPWLHKRTQGNDQVSPTQKNRLTQNSKTCPKKSKGMDMFICCQDNSLSHQNEHKDKQRGKIFKTHDRSNTNIKIFLKMHILWWWYTHIYILRMKWDRIKWDRMKWDRMKWDRMKWDRMKWELPQISGDKIGPLNQWERRFLQKEK